MTVPTEPAHGRSPQPHDDNSDMSSLSTYMSRALRPRRNPHATARTWSDEDEAEESDTPAEAQLFETPPEYTLALLRYAQPQLGRISATIFDPAAGNGAILNMFEKQGYSVLARDLYTMSPATDFLKALPPSLEEYDLIVLNPLCKYRQDFLRRALEIGAPFAQLMLATSFCSIGVRDALGDTPFDVVLLPRQHKFKNDGRMVSIHA